LQSVLRVSALNGWSITIVAGLSLVVTLLIGDWLGGLISVLVVTTGLIELHGRRLLTQGRIDGGRWLKNAQWGLMAVLCGYCVWQLLRVDPQRVLAKVPVESWRALRSLGYTETALSSLVRVASYGLYGAVIFASLLHQGCLLYFYGRAMPKIAEGFTPPPLPPPIPQ
jgi:hypothetical protein